MFFSRGFNPLPLKQEEETCIPFDFFLFFFCFNPLPLKQEKETKKNLDSNKILIQFQSTSSQTRGRNTTRFKSKKPLRVSIHFLSNKRKKHGICWRINVRGVSIHFLSNKRKKPIEFDLTNTQLVFQSTSSQTRGRNIIRVTQRGDQNRFQSTSSQTRGRN